MAAKKFDHALLLDCARELLDWIGLQDPMFAERIAITKVEYKLDDLQCLASYVSTVLDRGDHMVYSEREFLLPGYAGHLGPRECRVCHAGFSAGRATDEVCEKQACMDAYTKMLDEQFESASRKGA